MASSGRTDGSGDGPGSIAGVAAALLRHFDAHGRELPWRRTEDPYAIWISEVMLQQTRVETAAPYWNRWMRRFPNIATLAEAEVDDVLLQWQGLGYYSRARNLHRAARMVRDRFSGVLPADLSELRSLPGVGEYTAGAIASIAYGVPTPAVDGNVRRVLSRLYHLPDPAPAELRRLAARLVPAARPGDFNQALMELGATVCTPRAPACEGCPLNRWCRARAVGEQDKTPRPRRRAPVPETAIETAVVVRADGRVLLVRRPPAGLLGGMWEFPGCDGPGWRDLLIARAEPVASLEPVRHVFSHKVVVYSPTLYRHGAEPPRGGDGGFRAALRGGAAAWVPLDAPGGRALPRAQQRIAEAARRAWG